jgi:ABC-type Fe3+ transport system permease subunit
VFVTRSIERRRPSSVVRSPLLPHRLQLRRSDAIALVLWVAGAALFVTGIVVGPEEECDSANHDRYVVEAHRAGIALLTAAVAVTAAAAFLAAGAIGDRSTRSRVWHSLASVLSFVLAGIVAVIGLFELVAFSCLE